MGGNRGWVGGGGYVGGGEELVGEGAGGRGCRFGKGGGGEGVGPHLLSVI